MRVLMTLARTSDLMENFTVSEIVDGETKYLAKLSGHTGGYKAYGVHVHDYGNGDTYEHAKIENSQQLIEQIMSGNIPEKWSEPGYDGFNDFERLLIQAQTAGELPIPKPEWEASWRAKYQNAPLNPNLPGLRDDEDLPADFFVIIRSTYEEYGAAQDQSVFTFQREDEAVAEYEKMDRELQEMADGDCVIIELQSIVNGKTQKTLRTNSSSEYADY